MDPSGISMTGPLHYAVNGWIWWFAGYWLILCWSIPLVCFFCLIVILEPFLTQQSFFTFHNCRSLSFSLSLVYNDGFAGFYPLAICHFSFFPPHLWVLLLLPAMCSNPWLSIPHCSPLCSPLLVALCRCRIRPNNMTHKEGLNSLWFASRYQTLLYAVCRTLNGRWEHKMLTH